MGVRNTKRGELARVECKTLDAKFRTIVQGGLGCSAFEAEAVLGAVKEVYFPFLDHASPMAPPGKVTLIAVSADEGRDKKFQGCSGDIGKISGINLFGRRSFLDRFVVFLSFGLLFLFSDLYQGLHSLMLFIACDVPVLEQSLY